MCAWPTVCWEHPPHNLASTRTNYRLVLKFSALFKTFEDQVRSSLTNAYLGRFPEMAATSCKEIAENKPDYQSGYYWIRGPAGPVGVYCDMEPPFEQYGGWMRVATVDMSDKHSQCPSGLVLNVTSNKRTCGRSDMFANGGCASTVFSVHNAPYKKVCGKVIGYQSKKPAGFGPSSH